MIVQTILNSRLSRLFVIVSDTSWRRDQSAAWWCYLQYFSSVISRQSGTPSHFRSSSIHSRILWHSNVPVEHSDFRLEAAKQEMTYLEIPIERTPFHLFVQVDLRFRNKDDGFYLIFLLQETFQPLQCDNNQRTIVHKFFQYTFRFIRRNFLFKDCKRRHKYWDHVQCLGTSLFKNDTDNLTRSFHKSDSKY